MKYKMIECGAYLRVVAIKSFGGIQEGEEGGLIAKEANLSQEGNAWVSRDAQVYGNARVSGDAQVFGHAQVSGDARVSKTPINILGLRWAVTISDHHIQVGCELHLKAEWATFEEERIAHMDGEALEFWNEHRGTILKLAGVEQKL